MRYASVPYVTHDGAPVFHHEMTKRRGTVLETFQAVKFGGSKGGPGASAASWGGSGVPGVGGR